MEQIDTNEDNIELVEDREEMNANDIEDKIDEPNLKLYEVTTDISLLPNNPNSVWLNGILISLLFSDRIRNIILNKIESTQKYDKIYELFKLLIKLLEESPEKFKDEIDKLNDKVLLNLILDLSGIKRSGDNLKWCEYDIITILKKLNINLTDVSIKDSTEIIDFFRLLSYDNKRKNWLIDINEYSKFGNIKNEKDLEPKITKRRDNKYSNDKDKNPDILILFYNDMSDMTTNYTNLLNGIKEKDKNSGIIISNFFNPSTYNIKIRHDNLLSTGEIEFNGITYDLDVCLLNNNDFMSNTHCTIGITNNGERYTYNNWRHETAKTSVSATCPNSCSLFKYDWLQAFSNKDKTYSHCFNPYKCNLDIHKNINSLKDLCFSFNNGNRMLIFVKRNELSSKPDKVKFKKDIDIGIIRDLIFEIDKMKKPELITGINELTGVKNKYDNSTDLDFLKKMFFDESIKQLNIDEELSDSSNNNIVDIDTLEESEEKKEIIEDEIKGGKSKISKNYLISYIQKRKDMKGLSKMKKEELMRIYLRLKKRV